MKLSSSAVFFCFIAIFCLGSLPVHGAEDRAPLVLGAIYDLTGSQADLDKPSLQGARLAVEEVNRQGGLLGRPVRLAVADGQSNPEIIAARTAAMVREHTAMVAVMGLSDTDMVLAAAPVAARNRLLFVTSGATSPKLPAQVPEFLYLAGFGDNVQAAAAAEFAYRDLSARTVSVLFNSTMSYTRLLHEYFQKRFTQLGGRVLSSERYMPHNIGPSAARLTKADVIFLAAGPDDAPVAAGLLRRAGTSSPILGGDGFDSDSVWQKHPEIRNVYFTTHAYLGADSPVARVQTFREAYESAYPGSTANAFAALGYDTARLIIAAIEKARSSAPSAVLAAFSTIRDFKGVTGTISYADGSPIPKKSVSILKIEKGRRSLVREVLPAEIPAP